MLDALDGYTCLYLQGILKHFLAFERFFSKVSHTWSDNSCGAISILRPTQVSIVVVNTRLCRLADISLQFLQHLWAYVALAVYPVTIHFCIHMSSHFTGLVCMRTAVELLDQLLQSACGRLIWTFGYKKKTNFVVFSANQLVDVLLSDDDGSFAVTFQKLRGWSEGTRRGTNPRT